MRQVITAFVAMTCLFVALMDADAQPGGVAVGFLNNSHTKVVVKGYTIVGGVQRYGQILQMDKKGKAFEINIPRDYRFYTVYDGNNPQRVLLKDQKVPIQKDVVLTIITSPLDPTQVIIK
jgi:hypothetical protein